MPAVPFSVRDFHKISEIFIRGRQRGFFYQNSEILFLGYSYRLFEPIPPPHSLFQQNIWTLEGGFVNKSPHSMMRTWEAVEDTSVSKCRGKIGAKRKCHSNLGIKARESASLSSWHDMRLSSSSLTYHLRRYQLKAAYLRQNLLTGPTTYTTSRRKW